MEGSMKEIGLKIKCMVMEFIDGLMVKSIKDIIIWIRNKELESILILMGRFIMEIGMMVFKKERDI